MSLSDAKVRNAKPTLKPYKISDGNGLYLIVMPRGGKYWRVKYFFNGKEKLLALGVYPDVGLLDARERNIHARKLVAAGKDPGEEKKEAARLEVATDTGLFENVARDWHDKQKNKWSEGTAAMVLKRLEAHVFPHVGHKAISKVTSKDLLSVIRKIEQGGALTTARRVSQYCSKIFMFAIVCDRADSNPAVNLLGALETPVRKHHAYLTGAELPELLAKLEEYDGHPQTKLGLRLLLLMFPRTGELRGGEWKEIDFEQAVWRIPAERMKMADPHIVPLSEQAVRALKTLRKLTGSGKYLFPNLQGPEGYMSENTMLYALYEMGYRSKATCHGFRATASTVLNENGFAPDVIERQLAHCERNRVRAAYNHAQYLPERRKMMQWWADYLDEAAKKAAKPKT